MRVVQSGGASRRREAWMASVLLLLLVVASLGLAACGSEGDSQTSPSPKGEPILSLIGDEKTVELSLAEIKAMPAYEGWAGIKTSVGTLIAPVKFKGVPLTELAKLVGGITEANGVTVLAKDGYGMTLSYDQVVNEEFTTFDPATGDEEPASEPLTVILAYEREGKPIDPEEEGPLRLYVAQPEPAQLVDGHWTVKWVDRVEVKQATEDWAVVLKGAVDSQITRQSYTNCSSPGCHGAVWSDGDDTLWQGVPLWRAVGLVDDQVKHDEGAFNRKLAKQGYTVEVRSADGTVVTLPAAKIFQEQGILLAAKMSGQELPEEYFPVRLVGPGLKLDQMIGHVVKVVVNPPK